MPKRNRRVTPDLLAPAGRPALGSGKAAQKSKRGTVRGGPDADHAALSCWQQSDKTCSAASRLGAPFGPPLPAHPH